ncbi:MAG: hypothetical protein ACRD0Y_02205 [Terriglobales bacterium]
MDGLNPNSPELCWADLDREWAEFWASLDAHRRDHAIWFTPARSTYLEALLVRSRDWRKLSEPQSDADARNLYAEHLRRLQPILRDLQSCLASTAEQLLRERDNIRTKREWALQQARPRRLASK